MGTKVAAVLTELSSGFALTGLEVIRVKNAEEAGETLETALESGEYGMIIVEEALLAGLDERSRTRIESRAVPLVVPIPGALHWSRPDGEEQNDEIAALIRRAVGYQLNIHL